MSPGIFRGAIDRPVSGKGAFALLLVAVLSACGSSVGPQARATRQSVALPARPTPPPAVVNTGTAPPKLTLRMLPVRTGVPLTAQAEIKGFSRCRVVMTTIGRSGAGRVISNTNDLDDGPRSDRANGAANYLVIARVPAGSRRVTARAACTYRSTKGMRNIQLTAHVPVPGTA